MTEHKDTAGNTLRENNGQWEILQAGVGWREFVGMTFLIDGRVIDTRPAPAEAPDVIDQKQHQKQLEDDLLRHYAGIALEKYIPSHGSKLFADIAHESCQTAQAMIDELKKRGRL